MVVPTGPSCDRHEAATWALRWPWYFFMGPRQTRGLTGSAGRGNRTERTDRTNGRWHMAHGRI
jgi:hypothetical protein